MLLDVTVNTDKVTSVGDKVEEFRKSFGETGQKEENLKLIHIIGFFNPYHLPQHKSVNSKGKREEDIKSCEWDDRKCRLSKDLDVIAPDGAGCRYLTLYPQANYALYHILGALEAAGCTLPSLNTDFRTGQFRYFFSVWNEFAYWDEGRACSTHLLKACRNIQKRPVCEMSFHLML